MVGDLRVLVVASAIASVVFFVLISDLAAHRTQIIQRDIGLNMRIIPAETELESTGFAVTLRSHGAVISNELRTERCQSLGTDASGRYPGELVRPY